MLAKVNSYDSDSDGDGVLDGNDLCFNTIIPEGVPTNRLLKIRYALTDGDGIFDTKASGGARRSRPKLHD